MIRQSPSNIMILPSFTKSVEQYCYDLGNFSISLANNCHILSLWNDHSYLVFPWYDFWKIVDLRVECCKIKTEYMGMNYYIVWQFQSLKCARKDYIDARLKKKRDRLLRTCYQVISCAECSVYVYSSLTCILTIEVVLRICCVPQNGL